MRPQPHVHSIEIRHLRYFAMVANEFHFGNAARRLHIVQPALSAQIKQLEEILGTSLLARTKRRVELTAAGKRFLVDCQAVLQSLENAVSAAVETSMGFLGSLRIGYVANAVTSGTMATTLQRFRRAVPNVSLKIEEMPPRTVIHAIENGEIDVGFTSADLSLHRETLQSYQLGEWPWLLAISATHPLSARDRISLGDVRNETFVSYEEAPNSSEIKRAMSSTGDVDLKVLSTGSLTSFATYVAAGLGVGLAPEPHSRLSFPGIRFLPIDGLETSVRMSLVWLSDDHRPLVHHFVTAAQAD